MRWHLLLSSGHRVSEYAVSTISTVSAASTVSTASTQSLQVNLAHLRVFQTFFLLQGILPGLSLFREKPNILDVTSRHQRMKLKKTGTINLKQKHIFFLSRDADSCCRPSTTPASKLVLTTKYNNNNTNTNNTNTTPTIQIQNSQIHKFNNNNITNKIIKHTCLTSDHP